jgi:RimJ/RimL family protein N-acetyltransferase
MIRIELINRENRIEKRETLELVSNAIFGSQSESEFSEKFVPNTGRVPNPKVSNFTTFLIKFPKCLWVVYFDEIVVGFILISDLPHPNSIGFSINSKFSRMGIISSAWELIKSSPCIQYPLYACTSQRNIAALKLLVKLGFRNTNENFMFGDESSYKFILD